MIIHVNNSDIATATAQALPGAVVVPDMRPGLSWVCGAHTVTRWARGTAQQPWYSVAGQVWRRRRQTAPTWLDLHQAADKAAWAAAGQCGTHILRPTGGPWVRLAQTLVLGGATAAEPWVTAQVGEPLRRMQRSLYERPDDARRDWEIREDELAAICQRLDADGVAVPVSLWDGLGVHLPPASEFGLRMLPEHAAIVASPANVLATEIAAAEPRLAGHLTAVGGEAYNAYPTWMGRISGVRSWLRDILLDDLGEYLGLPISSDGRIGNEYGLRGSIAHHSATLRAAVTETAPVVGYGFEHEQPRIVAAAAEIADRLEALAAMLPQVST